MAFEVLWCCWAARQMSGTAPRAEVSIISAMPHQQWDASARTTNVRHMPDSPEIMSGCLGFCGCNRAASLHAVRIAALAIDGLSAEGSLQESQTACESIQLVTWTCEFHPAMQTYMLLCHDLGLTSGMLGARSACRPLMRVAEKEHLDKAQTDAMHALCCSGYGVHSHMHVRARQSV